MSKRKHLKIIQRLKLYHQPLTEDYPFGESNYSSRRNWNHRRVFKSGETFFICLVLYPIGDQKSWEQQAYMKGLAVKPITLKKMTQKMFLESINELLTNKKLYDNARQFQPLIHHEHGLEKTINEIERTAVSKISRSTG